MIGCILLLVDLLGPRNAQVGLGAGRKQTHCGLSIVDCRLCIVDCALAIVDRRLTFALCGLCIVDCALSIALCRLCIIDCVLSIALCRLRFVDCRYAADDLRTLYLGPSGPPQSYNPSAEKVGVQMRKVIIYICTHAAVFFY